ELKVRIELQRSMTLIYGLIVLASVVVGLTRNSIDDQRFGLEYLGMPDFGDRFVQSPHCRQIFGVPLMGGRVVRVKLQGSLESALSPRPVPLIKSDPGQRVVRLRKRIVKLETFGCGFSDSRKAFFRGDPVEAPQNIVAIGQPRVGQRITGIDINCLVKVLNPLLQSLPGTLVPEVPALQVELIRLSVIGVPLDEKRLLVAGQCKRKRTCNPFRYRVLQFEDVRASLFALISP